MASAPLRLRWQPGARPRRRASYGPGTRPDKTGPLARLRAAWAGRPALRFAARAAVLPAAAAAFWAIVQANAFAGGAFGYFELAAHHVVAIVLLANIAALALLGLIFDALDWLGPQLGRPVRRYGRWLRRRWHRLRRR